MVQMNNIGLIDPKEVFLEDANLLCGDSIVNYRTVQSFGNTELVVKKYKEFLLTGYTKAKRTHVAVGCAYGFAQLTQYFVFAAMFYAASKFIKAYPDDIGMDDIFIALFAMIFGAATAGSAAAFGPDIGKATVAAERIFSIIEHESTINALEMDKDPNKKRLKKGNVKGHIEFRNVWFRYPTRK